MCFRPKLFMLLGDKNIKILRYSKTFRNKKKHFNHDISFERECTSAMAVHIISIAEGKKKQQKRTSFNQEI